MPGRAQTHDTDAQQGTPPEGGYTSGISPLGFALWIAAFFVLAGLGIMAGEVYEAMEPENLLTLSLGLLELIRKAQRPYHEPSSKFRLKVLP